MEVALIGHVTMPRPVSHLVGRAHAGTLAAIPGPFWVATNSLREITGALLGRSKAGTRS